MKAIMVMYDSLNRHLLQPYGCQWTQTENFQRLAEHTVVFDKLLGRKYALYAGQKRTAYRTV